MIALSGFLTALESVAGARGCLPPGANVCFAAPGCQISSAIMVTLGVRAWGVNQPSGSPPLPYLSQFPLLLSSSHFPPLLLPFVRSRPLKFS